MSILEVNNSNFLEFRYFDTSISIFIITFRYCIYILVASVTLGLLTDHKSVPFSYLPTLLRGGPFDTWGGAMVFPS